MKILQFVLGNPLERFINNRKDSFENYLKEDIIFFGPINKETFNFKGKNYPILKLNQEISIDELFSRLPSGWYPDIVLVETPILNYIPDFYKCPVLTVCSSRDAWGEIIYNRSIMNHFDAVVYQTIDIELYHDNLSELIYHNGSFYTPKIDSTKIKSFSERKIDILSIANINNGLYHERYKTFVKISSELGSTFNIKFIHGISKSRISEFYRESKIVIDWSSVRSLRVNDAIKHGCLCFSNEDNILIKDTWTPFKEYIPYNTQNVIGLLKKYLLNKRNAEEIIFNSQQKLSSLLQIPGDIIMELIKDTFRRNVDLSKRKKLLGMSKSEIYYSLSTPLSFNNQYAGHNHPAHWRKLYFERIDKALSYEESKELRIKELIESTRMAFLLNNEEKFEFYASRLEKLCPEYGWIYYLRARLNFSKENYIEAVKNLNKAINSFNNNKELVSEYILPFIERGNSLDGRRILDYIWESIYHHKNKFQQNVFFNAVFTLWGQCEYKLGNEEEAIKKYHDAIDEFATPKTGHLIYPLLLESNKFLMLKEIAQKVINDSPYDMISNLYLALSCLFLKDKKESKRIVFEYAKRINSFYNKSKFFNKVRLKKYLVKLTLISLYFPKILTVTIIIKIINKVGNKL